MDFTLDQLLTITGRLDDAPGFDTPRERFRRFLKERLTTLEVLRVFVQQCRERSGEQSHRALQDAVILAGRFLGFESSLGPYQFTPGTAPSHGAWQSRHRLHATLVVCTDLTADPDLDACSRAVAEGEGGTPRIGLFVTTSFYAGKARLEQEIATGTHPHLRVLSLDGLLRLCTLADRYLEHEDVLQLLHPPAFVDTALQLPERLASRISEAPVQPEGTAVSEAAPHERRYWVNAMRLEPFTPTEQIVRSLLGTRQLLGINPVPGIEDRVRAGDGICVFIEGRGVVAHAQIVGILADGSKMIRDSQRFTHILRLTNVTVYASPVFPSQELSRKFAIALKGDVSAVTAPISQRDFDSVTGDTLSATG